MSDAKYQTLDSLGISFSFQWHGVGTVVTLRREGDICYATWTGVRGEGVRYTPEAVNEMLANRIWQVYE